VRVAHTRAVLRSRSDHFNIPELRSRSDHRKICELSSRSEHIFQFLIFFYCGDCGNGANIFFSFLLFITLIIARLEEPKGTWRSPSSPAPPDHAELLGYLEQTWCTQGSLNSFRIPSFPFLWKTKFSSSSAMVACLKVSKYFHVWRDKARAPDTRTVHAKCSRYHCIFSVGLATWVGLFI
jgi:hypothetical protein